MCPRTFNRMLACMHFWTDPVPQSIATLAHPSIRLHDGRKLLRQKAHLLFWNPYSTGARAVPSVGYPSGPLVPRNWPPVKPPLTCYAAVLGFRHQPARPKQRISPVKVMKVEGSGIVLVA